MKNRFRAAAMSLGLAAALIVSAGAQSPVKVTIPFDFNVGDTTLKAGDYSIKAQSPGSAPQLLVLQDTDGKPLAVVNGIRIDEKENNGNPHLSFRKYEDRYFLSQVWFDGTSAGVGVRHGRQEQELAKRDVRGTENRVVALAK